MKFSSSKSPCNKCKRRRYCEDKKCQKWRNWFNNSWEELRKILGAKNG